MLNSFPLNYTPLNSMGVPDTGGVANSKLVVCYSLTSLAGYTQLEIASKRNYILPLASSVASIRGAAVDMYNVIKQVVIDAGLNTVESVITLGDGVEATCLDITVAGLGGDDAPRYYLAIPTDSASTKMPTLGTYRGESLATSPTYTYITTDDLDRNTWAFSTQFQSATPTLHAYANGDTGTVWFAVSFGGYAYVLNAGVKIPRIDNQSLIDSYPRYGVYSHSSMALVMCYYKSLVNDNGIDTSNSEMPTLVNINSLISSTTLPQFETIGGIPNATRLFSYALTPTVNPYWDWVTPSSYYQIFSTPAIFSELVDVRGVFTADDISNFSTYVYTGKSYCIIKNDFYRIEYMAPVSVWSISVVCPDAGFVSLADWVN